MTILSFFVLVDKPWALIISEINNLFYSKHKLYVKYEISVFIIIYRGVLDAEVDL
jgi:hypothetical protein